MLVYNSSLSSDVVCIAIFSFYLHPSNSYFSRFHTFSGAIGNDWIDSIQEQKVNAFQ